MPKNFFFKSNYFPVKKSGNNCILKVSLVIKTHFKQFSIASINGKWIWAKKGGFFDRFTVRVKDIQINIWVEENFWLKQNLGGWLEKTFFRG
jgi:hypothetical protein